MADLKITERDDYEELENVQDAIADGGLDIDALWKLVATKDIDEAAKMLYEAGFEIDEEEVESGAIDDVKIVSTPDDVLGDFYRIWIRLADPERAHVHDDECRRRGCSKGRTRHHGKTKENPGRIRKCDLHDEPEECEADPSSCRYGGCDAHGDRAPECMTKAQHYADTKSFMCDEGRKQFLKDYRWDDRRGEWVQRR